MKQKDWVSFLYFYYIRFMTTLNEKDTYFNDVIQR